METVDPGQRIARLRALEQGRMEGPNMERFPLHQG
jgi:hypothetical protein